MQHLRGWSLCCCACSDWVTSPCSGGEASKPTYAASQLCSNICGWCMQRSPTACTCSVAPVAGQSAAEGQAPNTIQPPPAPPSQQHVPSDAGPGVCAAARPAASAACRPASCSAPGPASRAASGSAPRQAWLCPVYWPRGDQPAHGNPHRPAGGFVCCWWLVQGLLVRQLACFICSCTKAGI